MSGLLRTKSAGEEAPEEAEGVRGRERERTGPGFTRQPVSGSVRQSVNVISELA